MAASMNIIFMFSIVRGEEKLYMQCLTSNTNTRTLIYTHSHIKFSSQVAFIYFPVIFLVRFFFVILLLFFYKIFMVSPVGVFRVLVFTQYFLIFCIVTLDVSSLGQCYGKSTYNTFIVSPKQELMYQS